MVMAKDNDGEEHDVIILFSDNYKDGKLLIGFCKTHSKLQMQFRSHMINFDYDVPVASQQESGLSVEEYFAQLAFEAYNTCEQLYVKGSEQSWMNYQQDLKDGNVEHKIPIQ